MDAVPIEAAWDSDNDQLLKQLKLLEQTLIVTFQQSRRDKL